MTHPRSLAGLAFLLLAGTAPALSLIAVPLPVRVASADGVYVGKVVSVTDTPVKAEAFKGDERMMHVATVKVGETILGQAAREVKVGFFLPPERRPGAPLIAGGGYFPRLSKDEEGCWS